jgi:hypothetical protein
MKITAHERRSYPKGTSDNQIKACKIYSDGLRNECLFQTLRMVTYLGGDLKILHHSILDVYIIIVDCAIVGVVKPSLYKCLIKASIDVLYSLFDFSDDI